MHTSRFTIYSISSIKGFLEMLTLWKTPISCQIPTPKNILDQFEMYLQDITLKSFGLELHRGPEVGLRSSHSVVPGRRTGDSNRQNMSMI
jgi:hypothetical protein